MRRFKPIGITVVVIIAAALLIHCSEKDKGTTPSNKPVEMTGQLQFSNSTGITMDQVIMSFGANQSSVDTTGAFKIRGNGRTPGLAMAADINDKVLLMKVIPDPAEKLQMELDAHSTAQALVFLHPFVCISDPIEARQVLENIDSLVQFHNLEVYLEAKMQSDLRSLNDEDPMLDSLVSRAILAYVETYPSQLSKLLGAMTVTSAKQQSSSLETPPEILPSTERGGLQLTYEGSDKFRISNSACRWAFCTTPTDSFFIFPSGDFLDLVKNQGKPWPPSKSDFTMHVTPGGDTSRINIYGYGFLLLESNSWHDLSFPERNWAHYGGLMTIIFELGRHTLGVITNVAVPLAGERIAPLVQQDLSLISFFYTEMTNAARLEQYINAKDPWGASYWITKQFFSRLLTSPATRQAF